MLVSVIIPVYNVADYLERCLESILAQTYRPIEVWLIDNNSQDGTAALIKQYCENYPSWIRSAKEIKQGAPAARNKGLALAKGEWIQFMDADDELEQDKIAHQVALVKKSQLAPHLIVGSYNFYTINDGLIIKKPSRIQPLAALFISELGNTNSNLWHRTTLNEIGGWNESYNACQEYELMSRIVLDEPLAYDDYLGTKMYQRKKSISYRSNAYAIYNFKLRAKLYPQVQALSLQDTERKQVDFIMISAIKAYSIYDKQEALAIYRNFFPKGYQPDTYQGKGIFYQLFRILGFENAISILVFFRKFRRLSSKVAS